MKNEATRIFHARNDLHLLRKIWHIATGVAALWLYLVSARSSNYWAVVSMIVFLMSLTMEFIRLKNPNINTIFCRLFGPLMRQSEKKGLSGMPFYALGISLTLYFYSPKIALLAITFLVFADPLSSFFGVLYGKRKILPNKSLEGCLAGFLCCFFITLCFTYQDQLSLPMLLGFSVLCGLIGSLSEMASSMNIDDNLTIPVISGAGITILNKIFHLL